MVESLVPSTKLPTPIAQPRTGCDFISEVQNIVAFRSRESSGSRRYFRGAKGDKSETASINEGIPVARLLWAIFTYELRTSQLFTLIGLAKTGNLGNLFLKIFPNLIPWLNSFPQAWGGVKMTFSWFVGFYYQ